ncbi:MAG: hypothetical protein RNU03_05720 [Candidatus Sedimenticola sp. (ex Thyasira tokunagai)]
MSMTLLSGKELLLAVVPGGDGQPVLHYAMVDGRRIRKVGEGEPAGLTGPMRAAVFSPAGYFERVDLAAPSPKLLPLAARRHLDAELVFDEPYRLRVRSRVKRERTIAADMAAMPELDLDTAVALLPLEEQPCLQMVPVELAIAALVRKATAEPVIVLWEKGGVLLSLLIAEGMIEARTRENVSAENRELVIARAEASLRTSASHRGEGREIFLTLGMGDLCGHGADLGEKSVEVFEKKLAKLYRGRRGMAADIVLRSPELYGLPFVDDDWNFQEKNYRDQVQSWRYAKPVAAAAGVAGILFALYGGFQHLQAMNAASEFDKRQAKLLQTQVEIGRILPSEQAMATARSGLQVQVQSLSEVRLDHMLDWLTHLVPEGVIIRSLVVEPEPPPRGGGRTAAVKHPPGQKPFLVKMEIVLAETSFDAAEASSAELVRRLSRRLDIVESRLAVPAPEQGMRRNVVLVVAAHARAVKF